MLVFTIKNKYYITLWLVVNTIIMIEENISSGKSSQAFMHGSMIPYNHHHGMTKKFPAKIINCIIGNFHTSKLQKLIIIACSQLQKCARSVSYKISGNMFSDCTCRNLFMSELINACT